jgi:hypothetical protein
MIDSETLEPVQFQFGPQVVRSYKRLAYSPWHAIAEFVDNSTQSYLDNKAELDADYRRTESTLAVAINYDGQAKTLSVSDNAMGMTLEQLRRALIVGEPPEKPSSRSRFGLGLKTAASWLGDVWSVDTKRLGSAQSYRVQVDVEAIASGTFVLPTDSADAAPEDHFTKISIQKLHRLLAPPTQDKIRRFLSSMYRSDLRQNRLSLSWNGEPIRWSDSEYALRPRPEGGVYRKDVDFEVNGKRVIGWLGILQRGSRTRAGISLLHGDRVVRGSPEAWRPSTIFGQHGGSNDLVNQRITGELNLDDFEVSHTKDDILWQEDEESEIQDRLAEEADELVAIAEVPVKDLQPSLAPDPSAVRAAVDRLQLEIASPQLKETVEAGGRLREAPSLAAQAGTAAPAMTTRIGSVVVDGYVAEGSSDEPFLLLDTDFPERVAIVLNLGHPHIRLLDKAAILEHFRHSFYTALAEWRANGGSSNGRSVALSIRDELLRLEARIAGSGDSAGPS